MTNNERIQKRIERAKLRRAGKKSAKHAVHDDFNSVITYRHYVYALGKCNVDVSWKSSVQKYNQRGVLNIHQTITDLHEGKKQNLNNTRRIPIYERGKKRIIVPIIINDRMTQRVICDHSLVPIIKDTLIYDNGASLQNKGVEFTRQRIDKHLHDALKEYGTEFYALTFDFKSFFDSIPHATCLKVLKGYYTDQRMIDLIMDIVKSYQRNDLKRQYCDNDLQIKMQELDAFQLHGICLGSQISQVLALIVPNKLDHFIKDVCGVRHYIRYMDDGIIFSNDKEFLHNIYKKMQEICAELGLVFNSKKTHIVKMTKGIVFLKVRYRVLPNGKILKTLTRAGIVRMRRKLKKFRHLVDQSKMTLDDVYNSLQSWLAHSKKACSYKTRKNMLKLYNELFEGYRITKKWERQGGRDALLQNHPRAKYRWSWDFAEYGDISVCA